MANFLDNQASYGRPAEQPLLQTYVPLPFENVMRAGEAVQKRADQAQAIVDTNIDALKHLKALESVNIRGKDYQVNDQARLNTAIADEQKQMEEIAAKYPNMASNEYSREVRKWASNLAQRATSGDIGTLVSNKASYEAKQKEAQADKFRTVSDWRREKDYQNMENYVKDAVDKPYQIAPLSLQGSGYDHFDRFKYIDEHLSHIKPDSKPGYDALANADNLKFINKGGVMYAVTAEGKEVSDKKISNALHSLTTASPEFTADVEAQLDQMQNTGQINAQTRDNARTKIIQDALHYAQPTFGYKEATQAVQQIKPGEGGAGAASKEDLGLYEQQLLGLDTPDSMGKEVVIASQRTITNNVPQSAVDKFIVADPTKFAVYNKAADEAFAKKTGKTVEEIKQQAAIDPEFNKKYQAAKNERFKQVLAIQIKNDPKSVPDYIKNYVLQNKVVFKPVDPTFSEIDQESANRDFKSPLYSMPIGGDEVLKSHILSKIKRPPGSILVSQGMQGEVELPGTYEITPSHLYMLYSPSKISGLDDTFKGTGSTIPGDKPPGIDDSATYYGYEIVRPNVVSSAMKTIYNHKMGVNVPDVPVSQRIYQGSNSSNVDYQDYRKVLNQVNSIGAGDHYRSDDKELSQITRNEDGTFSYPGKETTYTANQIAQNIALHKAINKR